MVRNAARLLLVVGLVGLGWTVGRAQTPADRSDALSTPAPPERSADSDFELQAFTTANGKTEIRCVRGCRLTWAPTGTDMLYPDFKIIGNSASDGTCISPNWNGAKNCHILGWTKFPK